MFGGWSPEWYELTEFRTNFDKVKDVFLSEVNYNSLILVLYQTIENNWINEFKFTIEKLIDLENKNASVEIQELVWNYLFNLVLFNNRTEMLLYLLGINNNVFEYFINIHHSLGIKIQVSMNIFKLFKFNIELEKLICDKSYNSFRYYLITEKKQFQLNLNNSIILTEHILKILSLKYGITKYEDVENLVIPESTDKRYFEKIGLF